jgi:hypothetical protein
MLTLLKVSAPAILGLVLFATLLQGIATKASNYSVQPLSYNTQVIKAALR